MVDDVTYRADQVHPSVYIAPGAVVLGDVTIGERSSVWFNAVVRGDVDAIKIGSETNIQDGAVLHADEGVPCTLGDRVTVGHNAIVHGCRVADNVIIGMGSVIMNGAVIGSESIVAVGAVVTEGTVIPAGSLVMGVPAKVRKATTEQNRMQIAHAADHYIENARRFKAAQEANL